MWTVVPEKWWNGVETCTCKRTTEKVANRVWLQREGTGTRGKKWFVQICNWAVRIFPPDYKASSLSLYNPVFLLSTIQFLRVFSLLMALESDWSPSHTDGILEAVSYNRLSPVSALAMVPGGILSLSWPLLTASQPISTFLASVHTYPSYTIWHGSYSWSTAFIMPS